MSKAFMGNMRVAFPIESISRKLALRSEIAGKDHIGTGSMTKTAYKTPTKYLGGMVRTYTVNAGDGKSETVTAQYLFFRKNKAVQSSQNVMQAQERFAAVSAGVKTLIHDLSQLGRVGSLYRACRENGAKRVNGVGAVGYAKLRDWVFAVQMAGLIADPDNYDVAVFPQALD